jgi:hypothetical protein
MMKHDEIYSAAQLTAFIQEVGFLPLLDSGIQGYSAEEMVADDCRYVVFDDGGWDWPLWKWKGPIVSDGSCVYGKFFNKKLASSVASGGPTSATTVAANILCLRKKPLTTSS